MKAKWVIETDGNFIAVVPEMDHNSSSTFYRAVEESFDDWYSAKSRADILAAESVSQF